MDIKTVRKRRKKLHGNTRHTMKKDNKNTKDHGDSKTNKEKWT